MRRWQKQGLLFAPKGDLSWARSYAHIPTVELTEEGFVRVYFASLDAEKFGRIGYVDLDFDNPKRIRHVATEPVLGLGELGTFDDSGAVPSCVLRVGEKRHLYYIGFQRTERVPYMLFSGLAIGNADGSFTRTSTIPILDRTPEEPYSRSAPFVLLEDGIWKMWYWSCRKWVSDEQGVHYSNVVRYATSADGATWKTDEHVCIAPNEPDEYSIGRPCVLRQGGLYRMWFSARSFSRLYVIGYAESGDGLHWERRDEEAGIEKSATGWDSEMICYPYVIEINGKLHMFYNGNQHGATGFGYAVLEGVSRCG
ncbi:MAG: hypothetical protein M3Z22_03985 [Verrucomicrobiota bacterium]|nr:hypothetical protein [Verrucomicrobiota bacterium]